MSAADVAPAVPSPGASATAAGQARPQRGWALRFLGSELRLIFGRRRNLAGLRRAGRRAGDDRRRGQAVRSRSRAADPTSSPPSPTTGSSSPWPRWPSSWACSCRWRSRAIAGDSVAGEANIGTLRYLLRSRSTATRLLAVKYAAIVVFSIAATCW